MTRLPEARTIELTGGQVLGLRTMIRGELRRAVRRDAAGRGKFGDEWEDGPTLAKIEQLRELYRLLGGDPDRITNLGEEGADGLR